MPACDKLQPHRRNTGRIKIYELKKIYRRKKAHTQTERERTIKVKNN